jgi:tetratricopeptide (TPR) repeat protein
MARAATKGRKRPQPDARRPAKRSGRRQLSAAEQTLFFSRIRRQAKWVFVFLALVFAGGFVFFGVGSGNNSSLGDLFNNLFSGGSSGPSVSSSLKKTQQNPADAKAWHDLATAYQDKQRTQDAIGALSTYTALRPKDAKGLAELAALQRTQAQNLQQNVYVAQVLQQDAGASATFALPGSSPFGKALNPDPISQAWQGETQTRSSNASIQVQSAYAAAIGTYQRLAALSPNDASVQLDLATTAESAGNTTVEIAALKRAAKLLPDQAAQIREKIKGLQGHK